MKNKLLYISATILMLTTASSLAAQTSTGTLTVTATVTSSINLVFNSDAAGVALTGSGTNTATLAFGNISAFGALATGVTRPTVTATTFTVSSAMDVNVTKANSASANYTLKAQLGAADAVNTWAIGGVTVTSASAGTVTATGAYGTNANFPVALTVPFTTASATVISNTVNFTATAN
jgi:hypothetical protein